MTSILERTIELKCTKAHAFRVFVEMADLWWPPQHRKFSESTLHLEPTLGGKFTEKSQAGETWVIGELTRYDAPDHLELNWFPGSPHTPTHVSIQFTELSAVAQIHLQHRAISDAANVNWPEMVARFAKGWDTILPALKSHIEGDASL